MTPALNFPRPMGVPGEGHPVSAIKDDAPLPQFRCSGCGSMADGQEGDMCEWCGFTAPPEPATNLSIDHESADEHLGNASQLLRCADFLHGEQQRVTIEAATERIAMALRAIAERRLVPRSRTEMAVSA